MKEYGDAAKAHSGRAPTRAELALMERGFNSGRLLPFLVILCREPDVSVPVSVRQRVQTGFQWGFCVEYAIVYPLIRDADAMPVLSP
jgi:hypothetical protein